MHNLVNMLQFYKEVTTPDLCAFQIKSKKVCDKFHNRETLNELLLSFQRHLSNVVKESVMPLLSSSRKWLLTKIMLEDSSNMDALYRFMEVTYNSKDRIDLCKFKADLDQLVSKFTHENQFILEQLITSFIQILNGEMANFRQNFIDQNLSFLTMLDSKEPYNTHELGELYAIWGTNANGLGNACKFQGNLNSLLKQIRTNEGRTYINEFVVSLQNYLRKEAEIVFLKLEIDNEQSLKNLLDETQQDYIHYQRLKLTLFDDLNKHSAHDLCHIVKSLSKITQKFTQENAAIVKRMMTIVFEDLFVQRLEALYQVFFGKNKEVIVKIMDTQDLNTFLTIGKLFGFTLAND